MARNNDKVTAALNRIGLDLQARVNKWKAARYWYQEACLAAREMAGDDADTILVVAACLSPLKRVGEDIGNALRLIRAYRSGGVDAVYVEHNRKSMHQFMPNVISALNYVQHGTFPAGEKVGPFARALVGGTPATFEFDGEEIPWAVVDRHMTKPWFEVEAPNAAQRRAVSIACLRAGRACLGIDGMEAVRQAQACAWHESASRGGVADSETITRHSYANALRGIAWG